MVATLNRRRIISKTATVELKARLRRHYTDLGKSREQIAEESGLTVGTIAKAIKPDANDAGSAVRLARFWGIAVPEL
jgi:transcriptional regulator with XRE-family HTH domain